MATDFSFNRLLGELHGRGLSAARSALEAVNRVPALRRAGAVLCGRLTAATVNGLSGYPEVAAVLTRGSYGRGQARPFTSDLDLVVVVAEPDGQPSFDATLAVRAAIERASRRNPLVRDRWQLTIGESDLGLVSRYADLFATDEWSGAAVPEPHAAGTPRRLAAIASWNRQHMWTDTALRCAASPEPPTARELLAFTAAEKKAAYHAAIVADPHGPRRSVDRRPLPGNVDELTARLAALVVSLGATADVLGSDPRAAAEQTRPWTVRADARALDWFESLRVALGLTSHLAAAYLYAGTLALITEEAADLTALCAILPKLARVGGRRVVVYTHSSARIAPLLVGVSVLWTKNPAEGFPEQPAFLAEQFFYEALFGGAELRLHADSHSSAAARRFCMAQLARRLRFLRDGHLLRDDTDALADLPPVDFADARAWFERTSVLWVQLRTHLLKGPPVGPLA